MVSQGAQKNFQQGHSRWKHRRRHFFSIWLDGNVSRPVIRRSRLVGELHDIAVLDHRIFGTHFLVHCNHHFSVQQELHQRAHAILVRFDEFSDRGRLRDLTFKFCFSDGIAKRQTKNQHGDHMRCISLASPIEFILSAGLQRRTPLEAFARRA